MDYEYGYGHDDWFTILINKYISAKYRAPTHDKRGFIFDKCWRENAPYHEWMASFDADEYIVLADKSQSIPEALQNYSDVTGVRMYWRIFSSSGLINRPPSVLGRKVFLLAL